MATATSDEEVYRMRKENPVAALARFPTDPESILYAQLELYYIPALPFIELFEPHVGLHQAVRGAAYRCITQECSQSMRESQLLMLGPSYTAFRRICCLDKSADGLSGVIARYRHSFRGYTPRFLGYQIKSVRDMLRRASENMRHMELVSNCIPRYLIQALTILDLEQLCLRAPCEESFQAAVDYVESLNFEQFEIPEEMQRMGFPADMQYHGALFQQLALPSAVKVELALYFKDCATRMLPGGYSWNNLFPSLLDAQLLDATKLSGLYFALVSFLTQFGVPFNAMSQTDSDDLLYADCTATQISFEIFQQALAVPQQQFYDQKITYLEFLLCLFCQTHVFRRFEAEIYSQIFEDHITFITADGIDFRGITVYLLLASRFAFLLYEYDKRYQFIYDKVVRNLLLDRQVLAESQTNTNELDYIIANLQRFSQGELALQQNPNKQQKAFWLVLKQLRMKGIQCINDDASRKLDNDMFKGFYARQSEAGLLNKVDCRVDVQGNIPRFQTSDLRKFYFNCNRFEHQELDDEPRIMYRLMSMIGISMY